MCVCPLIFAVVHVCPKSIGKKGVPKCSISYKINRNVKNVLCELPWEAVLGFKSMVYKDRKASKQE